MSRRNFLRPSTAYFDKLSTSSASSPQTAAPPPVVSGLAPYTGPWTAQEAGHLLSRTTFGTTFATSKEALQLGLEGTLDKLLADLALPAPPVSEDNDGITPAGESWVDQPYPAIGTILAVGVRRNSLRSWLFRLRMNEGISARETMALFWHNHFAINNNNEPRWNYLHSKLLRQHAFGDFRQFVKDITIDPLMLAFLDGARNTARAPNENYARELLELFTGGKGPQVGPGDYTHYTEEDVVAMAKSLTGWRNYGYRATRADQSILSEFVNGRHDDSTVQLSHRFAGQQFPSAGADTYANLVDLILEKKEVARYIVSKLYRWFVYYDISDTVAAEVIEPLATQFYEGNYAIKPVLRTLFSSQHFFDVLSQGPIIKHPIRFLVGILRQLEVQPNNPARTEERFYFAMWQRANSIEMADFLPPNVAGWKAFYQEPLYYRNWINSATLPLRKGLSDQLFANTSRLSGYGTVEFSLLKQVNQFAEPGELWPMIDEWVALLFPRPIPDSQRTFLKELLLPGLPDTQWAVEYANYQANPNDESIARALETNLRRMVRSMLEMPEYQLS